MSKMLEEIREQPRALERTLDGELSGVEALRAPVDQAAAQADRACRARNFRQRGYVRPLSAGDHDRHSGVSCGASVVTLYDAHIEYNDALVVAISQSGESTDTNAFLRTRARSRASSLSVSRMRRRVRWRASLSTCFWCGPARRRVSPRRRRTRASCWRCTCWRMRWVPISTSTNCGACRVR